jgi:hypothetical protein
VFNKPPKRRNFHGCEISCGAAFINGLFGWFLCIYPKTVVSLSADFVP